MKAFVFDTETSGLMDNHILPLDKQPEIIEFYGCLLDFETGEIEAEIDGLFKPSKPITDEITRITRIDNNDLNDKPPFSAVMPQVSRLLSSSEAIVAHNLSFDIEMLQFEYERRGFTKVPFPKVKLCTVEQTIHLKGFRLSLTALHEHLFGETFPEAHRAKIDTQALIRCTLELYKRGEL